MKLIRNREKFKDQPVIFQQNSLISPEARQNASFSECDIGHIR